MEIRQGSLSARPRPIPTSSTPSLRRALLPRSQWPRTEWVNESSSTPPLPSRQSLAPSTNECVQTSAAAVVRWVQGQVSATDEETGDGTHEECVIMSLQLRLQSTARARIGCHCCTEGPFINRRGIIFLIQRRRDKRFENKESAYVHAIHLVSRPIPALVQGLCPRVRSSAIIERIVRVINPCKVKSLSTTLSACEID